MPLSIYQIPLRHRFLQIAFHPRNNSIIILFRNGDIQVITPEGKEAYRLSFALEPTSFRINSEGNLLAILGKGELIFYNFLTKNTTSVPVHEKIQLIELYMNSVLLSGYQNSMGVALLRRPRQTFKISS